MRLDLIRDVNRGKITQAEAEKIEAEAAAKADKTVKASAKKKEA